MRVSVFTSKIALVDQDSARVLCYSVLALSDSYKILWS